MVGRIDLDRYTGYLRDRTADIVRAHKRGLNPDEIADLVGPARKYDGGYSSRPTREMIIYVLRRVGAMPPLPMPRPTRPVPSYHPPHLVRVIWNNLGRPLDMGGPRDVWIERGPWDEL